MNGFLGHSSGIKVRSRMFQEVLKGFRWFQGRFKEFQDDSEGIQVVLGSARSDPVVFRGFQGRFCDALRGFEVVSMVL